MTPLRALLGALAVGAVVPGLWAVIVPRSFYDDFPGAGHWVARLPEYSEHLVTDVGSFYLAFALLFAWAAVRPARALVVPVAVAWTLFSVVHLVWHVAHLGPFDTVNGVVQTASLALALAGAPLAIWLARRDPGTGDAASSSA